MAEGVGPRARLQRRGHAPGEPPVVRGRVPYPVVVVELAEGARMISTVVGVDPHGIAIGMPVEVVGRDGGSAFRCSGPQRARDRPVAVRGGRIGRANDRSPRWPRAVW